MILLDKNEYWKVKAPLDTLPINAFFALAVVEKQLTGTIYIDNTDHPETFYIIHPYGMSLLFGNANNDMVNSFLLDRFLNNNKVRNKHEWLQVFPDEWNKKLADLLGSKLIDASSLQEETNQGIVVKFNRANFRFNKEKYLEFKASLKENKYKIVRTDKEIFNQMTGTVIPKYFWDNADDFVNNGIGYTLIYDGEAASTAYTAYLHENFLELGIETAEPFWGKGFAILTCSALIDYCLKNGLEPVWSCRKENTGSYLLAQKLGFEPTLTIPFYRLCK
jgi:RimJ/RimL family protein N-acetyltransferase